MSAVTGIAGVAPRRTGRGGAQLAATLVVGLMAAWGILLCPLRAQEREPGSSAVAPQFAEKLERPGLPNLGRINGKLYRGGQPEPAGYDHLSELGIELVIDLNTSRKGIARERAAVESRGMRYVSLPWSSRSRPSDEQVKEFLRLIGEEHKTFVHCRHGSDRTGVMIALHRILREGWTPERALEEMNYFGFHGFWYGHLKQYVRETSARLAEGNERPTKP